MMEQCDAVYYLNGKRCNRQKGHAGEHCHIEWDRSFGERREWWGDDVNLDHWETVVIGKELCRVEHVTKDDGTEGVRYAYIRDVISDNADGGGAA